MRVSSILLLLACLVLSCSEKAEEKDTTSQKPNIILIMSDDQGWGDLSISGNTNLSTPNIDALAQNGVSFENFYVQPVCSPTRAELLTGRYAARTGVYSTSEGGERFNLRGNHHSPKYSKVPVIKQQHMANGTVECNRLTIPMPGALMTTTVLHLAIGETISVLC